ncbi:MAG: hypothetical protein HOE90_10585 [Bacteriovoracaceae bacterium]|nr:hypothetical protein [Bacteriovoracaceae bacterium]
MKVTGFDLRKSEVGKSLAFGRIIMDDVFEVEVQIMTGKNGPFVSYPSKKGKDGKWYNQFRILDRSISDKVQDQVIYFYEQNIKPLASKPE